MSPAAGISFAATNSSPSVSIRILRVARPIRPSPLIATLVMNSPFRMHRNIEMADRAMAAGSGLPVRASGLLLRPRASQFLLGAQPVVDIATRLASTFLEKLVGANRDCIRRGGSDDLVRRLSRRR